MALVLASIMAVSSPASAQGATGADDAIRAMQGGNCDKAVDGANKGLADGDPKAYFVVGMMRLRGLCIAAAPEKAVAYFEPAAKAGHVDSAYMLTMMHGLGLGVPQSYAQAGRWTIAMLDISDLGSGRAARAPKGPLDVDEAAAYGVIGTLAAMLRDRLAYPRSAMRPAISGVGVTVRISISPQGLRHELVSARKGTEASTADLLNRSTYRDAVSETLEAAIRELPRYDLPKKQYELTVPYEFILKAL